MKAEDFGFKDLPAWADWIAKDKGGRVRLFYKNKPEITLDYGWSNHGLSNRIPDDFVPESYKNISWDDSLVKCGKDIEFKKGEWVISMVGLPITNNIVLFRVDDYFGEELRDKFGNLFSTRLFRRATKKEVITHIDYDGTATHKDFPFEIGDRVYSGTFEINDGVVINNERELETLTNKPVLDWYYKRIEK